MEAISLLPGGKPRIMKIPLALIFALILCIVRTSQAQTVMFSEKFDSMGPAGTNLPPGWIAGYLGAVGSLNRAVMDPYAGNGLAITAMPLAVSDGSAIPANNVGTVFNFSTTGSSDRALGNYPRTNPSGDQIMQVAITNQLGRDVTDIILTYAGEQWRQAQGTAATKPEKLRVLLSVTSPTNGFTYLGTNFDFSAPQDGAGNVGLDGNNATNRAVITGTVKLPTALASGQTLYVRWHDWNDDATTDHFLAIDDVLISAANVPVAATAVTNWVAFNDHRPTATGTSPNATSYDMRLTGDGGVLRNFITGADLKATLVVTAKGTPDDLGTTAQPNAGTPAYNLFNGIVDVGNSSGTVGVRSSSGSTVTMTFTNLDVTKKYIFRGTSMRGGSYNDRWLLCTLQGAGSFTDAHVNGSSNTNIFTKDTFPAAPLTKGQVVINTGENRVGSMVGWDNIIPGPDGSFSIVNSQYIGPTPFGDPVGGAPAYAYSLIAIYLVEVSVTASAPEVTGFSISPAGFSATIKDAAGATLDAASLSVKLNGQAVTVSTTKQADISTIKYSPLTLLPSGSTNGVTITFQDSNKRSYTVTREGVVTVYTAVPAAYAVPAADVDKSKAGFRIRPYGTEAAQPNTLTWTEEQLAGMHGPNLANLAGADADGFLTWTGIVDFAREADGQIGSFTDVNGYPEQPLPGFPGTQIQDGGTGNASLEILTFMDFTSAGLFTMGVNSDDSFKVTAARAPADKFGVTLGQYEGGRASADSTFTIFISQAGIYPFRLMWENGTGGANVEWFTVTDTGVKMPINAANSLAIKAYREAKTGPFVKAMSPLPGAIEVPLTNSIDLTLMDATTVVQTGTIQLTVNGQSVTPRIDKLAGSKETKVSYSPPGGLPPETTNVVRLVYGDNASPPNLYTNDYSFVSKPTLVTLLAIDDRTMWRYDRSGNDLGTVWKEKSFNDSAWPEGPALLGDETSTVDTMRTPFSRTSDITGSGIITFYFRAHFNYTGPAGARLRLTHVVDDGAVFYLNGVEVYRFGIAANTTVTATTLFTDHENAYAGPFSISAAMLVPGDNVLAVEVHQSSATSSDIVFGAILEAITSGLPRTTLTILGPAPDAVVTRDTPIEFILGDGTQKVVASSIQLLVNGQAVVPTVNKPAGSTATRVTYSPAGGLPAGSTNTVKLIFSDDGSPASVTTKEYSFTTKYDTITLVAIDDKTLWSYDRSGTDLGTAWKEKNFNDSAWPKGAALLGDETTTVTTMRTPFSRFDDFTGAGIISFYFRIHFNYTNDPAIATLNLREVVDDGAVFYLNGVEVYRMSNMPAGALTYQTLANPDHENAWEGPFTIPSTSLVKGDNVLAVEVHQNSATSSDIVFGAELSAVLIPVKPPTPATFSSFTRSGTGLILAWTGTGTLQSADVVTGPWVDVANAVSPYTITPSGSAKFYRFKP